MLAKSPFFPDITPPYTWFPDLRLIFQQDRLLQTAVSDSAGVGAVVRALRAEPGLVETYQAYLHLVAGLTNPLVNDAPDFLAGRPGPRGERAFFPPSRAHETDLAKRFFGAHPIPDGYQLVRIAAGDIDLRPRPGSGWYDQLTWALEPLLRPEAMSEAPRLEMDEGYREHLQELFQGIIARTRETHVKHLEMPMIGASGSDWYRTVRVAPELEVEPLAEFYLRRGLAYGFVHGILEMAFGAPALAQMRRLTARGEVTPNLADELNEIQSLFLDAHAAVRHELGMPPDPRADRDPEVARTRIKTFAARLSGDLDLGQDGRMMVPLFHDAELKKIKVLAFLGWAARPVTVRYVRPPAVRVMNRLGMTARGVTIEFAAQIESLVYPATEEIYVSRLLDRSEFQRLCDRHQSRPAILEALR